MFPNQCCSGTKDIPQALGEISLQESSPANMGRFIWDRRLQPQLCPLLFIVPLHLSKWRQDGPSRYAVSWIYLQWCIEVPPARPSQEAFGCLIHSLSSSALPPDPDPGQRDRGRALPFLASPGPIHHCVFHASSVSHTLTEFSRTRFRNTFLPDLVVKTNPSFPWCHLSQIPMVTGQVLNSWKECMEIITKNL